MELIRAHRDRGVNREGGGEVGAAELWEEFDAVEEVDGVGDTEPDDIVTSDSCAR
jgi:hypothetical protein